MTIRRLYLPNKTSRATRPAPAPSVQQRALALRRARLLCQQAGTEQARALANRMALAQTGCTCQQLLGTPTKPSGATGAGGSGAIEIS